MGIWHFGLKWRSWDKSEHASGQNLWFRKGVVQVQSGGYVFPSVLVAIFFSQKIHLNLWKARWGFENHPFQWKFTMKKNWLKLYRWLFRFFEQFLPTHSQPDTHTFDIVRFFSRSFCWRPPEENYSQMTSYQFSFEEVSFLVQSWVSRVFADYIGLP